MQRMVWAVLITFAASLALGPWAIRELRKLKVGQNVYELAPQTHKAKQGTPTMAALSLRSSHLCGLCAARRGVFLADGYGVGACGVCAAQSPHWLYG